MHLLSRTPEQLFGELLAANPGRPFVTYYDEASAERSELSVRSLANWVVKTHFLLLDELGLGVGDSAYVALPAHWISVPAVLGALTAGLELTSDPARAAVAFVTPATAPSADRVLDVFAVSPASAAVGLRDDVPTGVTDYVAAVRPQPDKWAQVRLTAGPGDPGLDGLGRGQLCARAATRAGELGLAPGGRLLSARDWQSPSDWIDLLLAPLAVGASVVYVRNAEPGTLARRAEQERVTVTY